MTIVEPVTLTSEGFDIDSTQNMLHVINKFNDELTNEEIEPINKHMKSTSVSNMKKKKRDSWFYKTTEEHRAAVLERIDKLRNHTRENKIVPDIESQIEALRLLEIIEGGEKIPLPSKEEDNLDENNWPPVHKQGKVIVSGADVQSLFPSLFNLEASRLVKLAINECWVLAVL